MYQENDIKQMVRDVLRDVLSERRGAPERKDAPKPGQGAQAVQAASEGGFVPDISATSTKEQFFVPAPADREGYLRIKEFTPARIGVWRAGPRYNTFSMLRFRADHATAQDAVFTDVSEDILKQHGFLCGQSRCATRDEFITRPDLGRKLDDETRALFKKELPQNAKVLLMAGDGLSSAAIAANASDIIPSIKQGLKRHGIEIGTIPFVKYCRVGAMDEAGPLTGAEVVCLLIGERPGLVTAESMSAYMAYRPSPDKPEAWRTVVSNINRGGTPPAEAGAHIADILKKILDAKVSGVDLKL
jgi:ethanolamine ammonia-lyase small subunit